MNQEAFRAAFLHALEERLPSWKERIAESAQTGRPIEIPDPTNEKPPFAIDLRGDTVTILPFCPFGLDYISTASREDLEKRPAAVFAEPLDAVADFVAGQTAVSIERRRLWFINRGWRVRFIPIAKAAEASRSGAAIIAWPQGH